MCIGKEVTGSIHDQFEVLCGLEQMINDVVMSKFKVQLGLERCERKIHDKFELNQALQQT
jgi:hypothetical protein